MFSGRNSKFRLGKLSTVAHKLITKFGSCRINGAGTPNFRVLSWDFGFGYRLWLKIFASQISYMIPNIFTVQRLSRLSMYNCQRKKKSWKMFTMIESLRYSRQLLKVVSFGIISG